MTLLLEIDLSKDLMYKSPVGIDGLITKQQTFSCTAFHLSACTNVAKNEK